MGALAGAVITPWRRRCPLLLALLLLPGCVTSALWNSDRILRRSDRRLEDQIVQEWPPGVCQLRLAAEAGNVKNLVTSTPGGRSWILAATAPGEAEHLLARLRQLPDACVRVELSYEWLDGHLVATFADVVVESAAALAVSGAVPVRAFRRPLAGGYQARWQVHEASHPVATTPSARDSACAVSLRLVERRFCSQDPDPEWQKLALTPLAVAADCVVTVPLLALVACGLARLPADTFCSSPGGGRAN